MNFLDRAVGQSLNGGVPLTLFLLALVFGALALLYTPREEEPQIVVPVIDVNVTAPGLSARQVERQVVTPLEKLLAQIPGVEHVYSVSQTGQATVTLRFYVGEDREESLLNTYNKLYSNQHRVPPVVGNWSLRPVEVDDVPVFVVALFSEKPELYSDYELRRLADEVSTLLQTVTDTSEIDVFGGRPRTIKIQPSPEALAAHRTSLLDIVAALQTSNLLNRAGYLTFGNQLFELEAGDVVRSLDELSSLMIQVVDDVPIYLRDVAEIVDGPAVTEHYTWLDIPGIDAANDLPMVAISIAKQPGSNAVRVTEEAQQLLAELERTILPDGVGTRVLRDYGETANEKVNNLTQSLAFAILTVVIFLGVFLGWRQALVVALALPICYGITLALDLAFGYSINRVTLFALILALGLLVDDPITGVDNISRHLEKEGADDKSDRIIGAISEIRIPLVMSTVTIVLAFLPLAFITGMMGPYMAPMAFNVPVSVIASTTVAFLVTPWLAKLLIRANPESDSHASILNFYSRYLGPLLDDKKKAKATLWIVAVAFALACALPAFRLVPLKLLPFDNKNEFQVLIDMPESLSLEATAAVTKHIAAEMTRVPEVETIAAFVGTPSPMDFNGMVRRYYQRQQPNLAELRVTLVDKLAREHQSHHVVLRVRELLAPFNRDGQVIRVVEVPPGPPVLSTLVAEVYGNLTTTYDEQMAAARIIAARLAQEPHVVEVDTTLQAERTVRRFVTDKHKAALSGISTADVRDTLVAANAGMVPGFLQFEREAVPLPLEIRLAVPERQNETDLLSIQVKGQRSTSSTLTEQGLDASPQPLVALGEIGEFKEFPANQVIYRKDLRPVVLVTAELNGRTPAEVIADVHADFNAEVTSQTPSPYPLEGRSFFKSGGGIAWSIPEGVEVTWRGEGEWKITLDVFRDMGIAFVFALIAIFIVLRIQTSSVSLSLIIMSAIPLTMIGIMPGFWLLNQFGERTIAGAPEPVLFTATAMIGMIALAGIVVRNSLILVEFIEQQRAAGETLKGAVLSAGAVRMRPVLLTAGTTLLGNLIITLDPVFSGLAIAIIFGILASTLFTLLVVPIVYYLVFDTSDFDTSKTKSKTLKAAEVANAES